MPSRNIYSTSRHLWNPPLFLAHRSDPLLWQVCQIKITIEKHKLYVSDNITNFNTNFVVNCNVTVSVLFLKIQLNSYKIVGSVKEWFAILSTTVFKGWFNSFWVSEVIRFFSFLVSLTELLWRVSFVLELTHLKHLPFPSAS